MKKLLKILEAIQRKKPVGTLVLGRRSRSCELFIEEDRIYYAGREFSGRVDIDGLVQGGLLGSRVNPSILEAAISVENLIQRPLPEVLLQREVIGAAECAPLTASHIREEIFAHCHHYGESFLFQEGRVPEHLLGEDPRKAPLPLEALMALIKKRLDALPLIDEMIPSRKEIFVLTEKGMAHQHASLGDFGLQRIFDLIDGFRSLVEIVRDGVFFEFYVLERVTQALLAGHIKKTLLPEIKDISPASLDRAEAMHHLPAFKAAVKYSVDEIGARERLATVYERLGNAEEAVIQYNFIGDAFYRMKKVSKALKAYQRALELHPRDPLLTDKIVRLHQEAADQALSEGKRDLGLQLLRAAVKIRPDLPAAFERLLLLLMEKRQVSEVAELCDSALNRSRSERDITPALRVLKIVTEKFPQETLFRKKLINLFVDFGMPDEAVSELEELVRQEMEQGQNQRAVEILEKILKIDPEREDVRRLLRKLGRRSVARRMPGIRLSFWRVALPVLLLVTSYQYWSYRALQPLQQDPLAYGEATAPRSVGLVRTPREEELLALAGRAEQFPAHFPLSAFTFEAQRLAEVYRNEAGRMSRDRERMKEEILTEGLGLMEKGQQEAAVSALEALLVCPEDDNFRIRAQDSIDRIRIYERSADDLRRHADTAMVAGDWEGAYRAVRRLLDDYPLSRAVLTVEVPMVLRTIPEGARLRLGGNHLGRSPQRVRVRPGKKTEVEAEAPGFLPFKETLPEEFSQERLLLLDRKPLWTASLGSDLRYPPLVTHDLVLVVLANGDLSARSREDGTARFGFPAAGLVTPVGPPVEAEGRIYMPLNDGNIVRFAPTGEVDHRIKHQGLISTPLLVEKGHLIFGATNGTVTGFELAKNRPAWTLRLRANPLKLALAGPSKLCLSLEKGRLQLSEPGGRTVWDTAIGEDIVSSPVEVGGVLVIQTAERRLVTIDARNGSVLSRRPLGSAGSAVVLFGSRHLLVTEGKTETRTDLVEVDPGTSHETNRASLPFSIARLFDLPGAVGASLAGGRFLYLEREGYRPVWQYRLKSGTVTACKAEGRFLLLATDSGELAAFSPDRPQK